MFKTHIRMQPDTHLLQHSHPHMQKTCSAQVDADRQHLQPSSVSQPAAQPP